MENFRPVNGRNQPGFLRESGFCDTDSFNAKADCNDRRDRACSSLCDAHPDKPASRHG
jgi:hypothetical protein